MYVMFSILVKALFFIVAIVIHTDAAQLACCLIKFFALGHLSCSVLFYVSDDGLPYSFLE